MDDVKPSREPDEAHFRWMNEQLKAEARALGGELCRTCNQPIPVRAHPTHRDRHVCSSHCNSLLIRRWKRKVERGESPAFAPDARAVAEVVEENNRPPQHFATVEDAEFPYEHARWPKAGDVIERHGHETTYFALRDDLPVHPLMRAYLARLEIEEDRVLVTQHAQTGLTGLFVTEADGRPAALSLGGFSLGDAAFTYPNGRAFEFEETPPFYYGRELISDVDSEGRTYRWDARVFAPFPLLKLWTPERLELSYKRKRATTARNAYIARMRALGVEDAPADNVDPFDIYEAARWLCGICGEPINADLAWPHERSKTLDHIDAVTAGGVHQRANLQPAHLICNILKGNG